MDFNCCFVCAECRMRLPIYYKGAHQIINDPTGFMCSIEICKICEEYPPDDAE